MKTFISVVAVVILVWTFFPVYYMVLLSFTPTNDLFQPGLYVEHPTLRNYVYTMGQDNPFVRYFWTQLGTSLIVSVWTMVGVGAVAALGSFAMARMKFRFRGYVSGMTLFTYVIPSSFLAIPFFKMMGDYDLIDTKLALVLAMITFASPYALWVLSDYARSLPPEIEEAGALDGAGTLQTFFHLYLPLIVPPLIAIGTYAFLYAWNSCCSPASGTSRCQSRCRTSSPPTTRPGISSWPCPPCTRSRPWSSTTASSVTS